MPKKPKPLALDLIRIDGNTQSRLKINEDTVEDYTSIIQAGGTRWPFPPLDVFQDGTDYFLGDGFHRFLAALRAKRASVPCIVHKGTATDARIFGMTANDQHGLRMTRADKRACVEWLLDNGEKMTQKEVAEKAGAGKRLVQIVVAERKAKATANLPPNRLEKAHNAPFTPAGGSPTGAVSDPFDVVEDPFGAPETPEESDVEHQPPQSSNGRQTRGKGGKKGKKGKPPKRLDRSAYFKQWDNSIGPLVRLVDKIAEGVGEKHGLHHKAVHDALNTATEEMMEWMGVKK